MHMNYVSIIYVDINYCGTHRLKKCGCSKVPWSTLFEMRVVVSEMEELMIDL